MRSSDRTALEVMRGRLHDYTTRYGLLPGIALRAHEDAFLLQLVESVRRVKFIETVGARDISPLRSDPHSHLFDPVRAALLYVREGRKHDEACWLIFLSTLIGKHLRAGWLTTSQIYGALGHEEIWSFSRVRDNVEGFREWLEDHQSSIDRKVGNHRKYLSLSGAKPHAAGAAIQTYVEWVSRRGTHKQLFERALEEAGEDERRAFEILFESMNAVDTFGRTGRFDYLTMIGKVGLARLVPNSPHLVGATGPLAGAHLLFEGARKARTPAGTLDGRLVELGATLQVRMDVLEDAICNWQKNPGNFVPFRG